VNGNSPASLRNAMLDNSAGITIQGLTIVHPDGTEEIYSHSDAGPRYPSNSGLFTSFLGVDMALFNNSKMEEKTHFTTSVKSIDSDADVMCVVRDFIRAFFREDLFELAQAYVRENALGSVYAFRDRPGGLMRLVIGILLMHNIPSQASKYGDVVEDKLLEHYKFGTETIPPTMLIREAVALRIRLSTVTIDLTRELDNMSRYSNSSIRLSMATVEQEIRLMARQTLRSEDAALITDDVVKATIGRMFSWAEEAPGSIASVPDPDQV